MKKTIQSLAALALTSSFPLVVSAQTTVFSDTFDSGSTAQSATPASPTANSTAYEYFQQGGNPATPTVAAGDLHLAGRTTSSSISEAEALFTATPVTLATVGDWIDLTVVFTDTQNIFPNGSASTLNVGLYNSGGVTPHQGVRLDSTSAETGGSQGWNGYVGRIGGTGGAASSIYTRAAQTANGTSSQDQDLLFNGASGSAAYNSPAGTTLGSGTQFAAGLTAASVYTLDFQISLSDAGTLTISNALYSGGVVDSANLLSSEIGTATGTNLLTSSFDGFAMGWRYNSTSAANSIDVSSISVADSIQTVPEPGTLALIGTGVVFAAACYRRSRK